MTKDTNRKGSGFILLGLLLILAALALTVYNQWDGSRAYDASQEVEEALEAVIEENVANGTGTDVGGIYLDPTAEMAVAEVKGHSYIGTLRIPDLGLKLPVMNEWSYANLKIAPCRFSGSYYSDDMVIAGHNYARHFNKVKRAKPGTDVYFTNVEGLTLHYQIDYIETVQATQVEDMTSGDWDMTMFTCTTGGRARAAIRCSRVE